MFAGSSRSSAIVFFEFDQFDLRSGENLVTYRSSAWSALGLATTLPVTHSVRLHPTLRPDGFHEIGRLPSTASLGQK